MVSMYVMPVALSLMMWLMLIVDIPRVATILYHPDGHGAHGASRSTSTSSGIRKQAITPEKPHGRVGDCMSANACTGEEGLGGMGVFGGEARGSMGII